MNEVKFIYDNKFLMSYPTNLSNMSGNFKFEIIMALFKSTAQNYKNRGQSKQEYIEKITNFTVKNVLKTADDVFGE
ncbi:MAG: hypothetical protein ROM03_02025 [Mucispirillum sp.]|nr:hypothetical protein [Mucispirillum sp.]